jgi:hypothetical protein
MMDNGVSCNRVARRVAVTTISSRPASPVDETVWPGKSAAGAQESPVANHVKQNFAAQLLVRSAALPSAPLKGFRQTSAFLV